MKNKKPGVGDGINASNSDWKFSGNVCETFDDHVTKSVPLYKQGHELIAQLSDFFIKDNSVCYDIGCSTGAMFSKICERNSKNNVKFIGIDPISEMIEKAKKKHKHNPNIEFVNDDISNVDLDSSDLITSYYTLQFVAPKYRQVIADKIYESLNWGGAFFLFEKVRASDARFQDLMTATYIEYKLKQGFNAEEIFSKTRSLKGVLEPFSTKGNIDLMKRAGFIDYISIMKYANFEGLLFIK